MKNCYEKTCKQGKC